MQEEQSGEEPRFSLEEIGPSQEETPDSVPALAEEGARKLGPSPRALFQRRALEVLTQALALACMALAVLVRVPLPGWDLLRWGLAACLAAALYWLRSTARSKALERREVVLSPLAVEIRRDSFHRLVVFESLRRLVLARSKGGRALSLTFELEDDSVHLRDVEGLEAIFEAAALAKPKACAVLVLERGADWGEPLPWLLLGGAGALVLALLAALV